MFSQFSPMNEETASELAVYDEEDLVVESILSNSSKKEQQQHQKRRRLSPEETRILCRIFDRNPKPNATLRNQLASQLGMSARNIQVWFQNRRAKLRKGGFISSEDGTPETQHKSLIAESTLSNQSSRNNSVNDSLSSIPALSIVGSGTITPSALHGASIDGIDEISTNPHQLSLATIAAIHERTMQNINNNQSGIGNAKSIDPLEQAQMLSWRKRRNSIDGAFNHITPAAPSVSTSQSADSALLPVKAATLDPMLLMDGSMDSLDSLFESTDSLFSNTAGLLLESPVDTIDTAPIGLMKSISFDDLPVMSTVSLANGYFTGGGKEMDGIANFADDENDIVINEVAANIMKTNMIVADPLEQIKRRKMFHNALVDLDDLELATLVASNSIENSFY